MSEVHSQPNQQNKENNPTRDSIYIGKKPLMAYVTSTLIQLANQPSVTIKARGLSIGRAVDVSQIILKRMENAGYSIGDIYNRIRNCSSRRWQNKKRINNRNTN